MLFSAPFPRPEYPRPDRQRGLVEGIDWLNLNGPWQFRFDPQRRGHEDQWFAADGPDWREQIIVPFCWESLAAWGEAGGAGNDHYFSHRIFIDPLDVSEANHRDAARQEVGWYRRVVEIPRTAAWQARRIILTLGAADYFTEAWCNGVALGRQEGGYLPLEFDLTDALAGATRARLVIRVEDPMDNQEQPVGKQWGWYTSTSGIWQTVFVEPRAPAYIEYFRITPDIDAHSATFEIFCRGAAEKSNVTVEIFPPDAPAQHLTLQVEGGQARGVAVIDPVVLWEPSNPALYRVVFHLIPPAGEPDVVRGYFGMRKIHTAAAVDGDARFPARLCLNNRPIYLRGALYQSYHPEGVYTARALRTLFEDLAFAHEAGFDFLRIHLKLDDPLLLYCADTMGMLLMQDFPNFGEGGDTPLGRQRFEAMLRGGLQRDFNHPAIIAWCLFNETWGFGGQNELMKMVAPPLGLKITPREGDKLANTSSFLWVHEMWRIAKQLDPTRLVEDMSVVMWEHLAAYGHVDTDINSWHFYLADYAKARAHIEDVVAKTYPGSGYNYIEGYHQTGAPLINSEYGGVGALDGDRDISWTFKFLTNELRRHGQLSAYIFTQLTDVEWERNGLLNYDRSPKQLGYPPNLVNQGDTVPINAAPISRVVPGARVVVEVLASHFSRNEHEHVTLHWHYSGIDTLGATQLELQRGWIAIPYRSNRVEPAGRLEIAAPVEPMLCTLWVAAVNGQGGTIASNYIQHFVRGDALPSREERPGMVALRARADEWHAAEWSGGHVTREAARSTDSCAGSGRGWFEWIFRDDALRQLGSARRLRVLCEVSACRPGIAQTDNDRWPSGFELLLNNLPTHRTILPNHPHDSRGALSYLHGGNGAYGYPIRTTIEGDFLQRLAATTADHGELRFRCAVPGNADVSGGLTVYGAESGRYPFGPTLIIEWEREGPPRPETAAS